MRSRIDSGTYKFNGCGGLRFGGAGSGAGGLFFPRGLGVGYDHIAEMLRGSAPVKLIGISIAKSLMWPFSLGSWTSGGVLAPLLMI